MLRSKCVFSSHDAVPLSSGEGRFCMRDFLEILVHVDLGVPRIIGC